MSKTTSYLKTEKQVKRYTLIGNIEGDSARNIIIALEDSINKGLDFRITINSHGGDIHVMFQIVSLMQKLKKQGNIITTIVGCRAYSSASLIAAAGSRGHRYITDSAVHLMHGIDYNIKNPTSAEKVIIAHDKSKMTNLYDIYTDGKAYELFAKSFKEPVVLCGNDIIYYGLADSVE